MNIRNILTGILSEAFENAGYSSQYGSVTVSNRPDLCQFQCNGAMAAAKQYKKAPIAIAEEVTALLAGNDVFSSVTPVKPGFININLSDGYIARLMNEISSDDRLLLPKMEPKTIVVDYGGPNVAKPLHVGHLRTAIIGDSLYRLAEFLGYNVISDIHLGDWGLQMGMVISEIRRRQPDLPYFDDDYTGDYPNTSPVTADELNTLYPEASARAKTDPDFARQAAQATYDLQKGEKPGYNALWRQIWNSSIADLKKSYDDLGVRFDYWYGESDSNKYVPRVVEILTHKGLLRDSDGAMVVDVELPEDKEPMPPIIIVKSNGGDVYGSTDVATIIQRMEDWSPDEMWYVVDNRQALHFKQVFRCASLGGILGDCKCFHTGFGTMNGKDGKPYKTREGGVMRLSDLIETVYAAAYDKVTESGIVLDEEEKSRVAKKVGIAALKIGDLINHRTKDYVFDIDRFLSSDGKTGPYLQYTAVRINSVLEKAGGEAFGTILPPASDTERDLMLSLTAVPDALIRAYNDRAPNVICEAVFDITGVFNRFYAENRILACPDEACRESWLTLLNLIHRLLLILLSILGIEVPKSM